MTIITNKWSNLIITLLDENVSPQFPNLVILDSPEVAVDVIVCCSDRCTTRNGNISKLLDISPLIPNSKSSIPIDI